MASLRQQIATTALSLTKFRDLIRKAGPQALWPSLTASRFAS